MKKQSKEQKIQQMLKKADLNNLKIIILKKTNTKTKYISKDNILFVNPQVQTLVLQILKKQKKDN